MTLPINYYYYFFLIIRHSEYYHKSNHKNVQEQLENERAQKKKP